MAGVLGYASFLYFSSIFYFLFFFLINIFVFVNGKLYLIFGENTLICRDEEIIGVFSRLSEPFCLLVNMKLYVRLKCLFMSCF